MFQKEIYINRRTKLKESFSSGLLIFLGNTQSSMNYADNTYHFRQDSSFLYFFGLDQPGLIGLIDIDNDKEFIFGNDLTIDDIVWMGVHPTLSERGIAVGIEHTGSISDFENYIESARKSKKIHFLPPYRPENKLKLFKLLEIKPDEIEINASKELTLAVINQRNYKSHEEAEEIEKAVNTTVDMHLAAMRVVKPGMTEAEVAAKVYEVALAAGGNISFPIIATINGQTLHNHYHGNTIQSGQMFLLDAGAETAMHYAGDMSSTIPVDKQFTDQQKVIYDIALNTHNRAIDALKPGVRFKDIHLGAAKNIAEGLKDLGLMKGDIEEAVMAGAHAMFFPCGLGHMMGLDVHDMEDLGEVYVGYDGEEKSNQFGLKSLRLGRKLEPGFVLTIEPGIYFIPELIDLWKSDNKHMDFLNYYEIEKFRNFGGIRNEEDFLITENGARLLGKPLPKTIEDVEAERVNAF